MKIINKLQEGGKSNQFMDDWNQSRLKTGRFDSQLGNGKLEEQKSNRDSAPIFKTPMAYGYTSYIRATPLINSSTNPKSIEQLEQERRINASRYGRITKNRLSRTDAQGMQNTIVAGEYNSKAHTIYAPTEEVELHEQAHASKAEPQKKVIGEILNTENINSTNYYDRPTEVYSRLMELRKANNIDPNKVWTEKEIKQLRKSGIDFNILNRYKPEQVTRLFNEVAQLKPTSNGTLFAQKGGIIGVNQIGLYKIKFKNKF